MSTITTKASRVRAWTDLIEASLPSQATAINRLIGCPAIQPTNRVITSTSNTNLTLDSSLGLFAGSKIQLVVTSGTIPPEATPGYVFAVKTVVGNVVTVAHHESAPAIDFGLGVTASWQVRDEELSIVSPPAQWLYYAYSFWDVSLAVNTKFLTINRNKIDSASKTYDINYTRGSFRRSTAGGTPTTFNIANFAIVTVDNAITPANITEVIHQITPDNVISLSGTSTVSFSADLQSSFILE
jgi:hypothetical protein